MSRWIPPAALAAVALLGAHPAWALSMTVAPAQHVIEMEAGTTESRSLSITNNGTVPLTVKPYAWDWWYGEEERHEFAPPGTFERSGATWVSVVPEVLIVQPGTTGKVNLHISMPEGSSGGHYAVTFLEARAGTPETEGFAMRPGGRIAVPLLMQAEGTETHDLELLETTVRPPSATEPLTVVMDSRNTGDTHEFPEFMGAIRSLEDERILSRFRGEPQRMLPGQERRLQAAWSGQLAPGRYEVVGTLLYGDRRVTEVREDFVVEASAVEVDGSFLP